jgi:transglutaminase-like putative cysteine protease
MADRTEATPSSFDGSSFLLLVTLAFLSAAALQAADWTDHLSIVVSLAVLGAVCGTALARSRFGSSLAVVLALVYGAFALFWYAGATLDPGLAWRDRTMDLLGRAAEQVEAIATQGQHRDPLMFVMALAGLYWALTVRAGWVVFRQGRFWGAVLPMGLGLLVNVYVYAGLRRLHLYLAAYALLALWLALRVEIRRRDAEWRRVKAQVPSEAPGTVTRAGAIAAAALVVLAWTGPAFAQSESAARLWSEISRPWREARDRIGDAFSGLRGEVVGSREPYGDRLRLGEGREPADNLVMRVRAATAPRRNGRLYWRSRVYGLYRDGVWSSSEGLPVRMEPDIGDLPIPRYVGREVITFTFQPEQSGLFTLYVPAQPLWVNRTATARILPIEGSGVDVLQVEAAVPIVRGETYRTRGSIAVPLAEELRQAGKAYPEWAVEAYLDVPSELAGALHDHAQLITQGAVTPFDQAQAITGWLRENIEYRRVTQAPPEGRDPLEWFLFDYRIGFCNYYASAEVLLLRSLGIPARLAVGYARGAFNLDEGVYEVRGLDAHAWPEVFFPSFGWVEFEPTASQSAIIRPESDPAGEEAGLPSPETAAGIEDAARDEAETGSPQDAAGSETSWGEVLFLVIAWGGLLAAALVVLFRFRPGTRTAVIAALLAAFRMAGLEPPPSLARGQPWASSPLARVYAEWSEWLRRLGLPLFPSQTPNERARDFSQAFPEGSSAAAVIVEAYNRERFARQSVSALESLAAWDSLERHLRRAWWDRLARRWLSLAPLSERLRKPPPPSGV